jgi:hypothetical protein
MIIAQSVSAVSDHCEKYSRSTANGAGCQAPGRQSKSSGVSADLPAGKANLIKASYSAGMKPTAIARMFRLSQSVVNRVLDLPAKSKK